MVCINIPYVFENNRIDKDFAKKEIQSLDVSDSVKQNAYAAIYNLNPREVKFERKDFVEVLMLEHALHRLGVPYRRLEESEY